MQGATFVCCVRAVSHRRDGGEGVYEEQIRFESRPSDFINVNGTYECLQ